MTLSHCKRPKLLLYFIFLYIFVCVYVCITAGSILKYFENLITSNDTNTPKYQFILPQDVLKRTWLTRVIKELQLFFFTFILFLFVIFFLFISKIESSPICCFYFYENNYNWQ